MAELETEYLVEAISPWTKCWYFISRLHGLTRAIELAAVMREIKDHPTRVVAVNANDRTSR